MWNSLKTNLTKVKKEIDDCKDMENWPEQCQIVLSASYGFDYQKFYLMLRQLAQNRMDALKKSQNLKLYGNWLLGTNHMLFDLKQIAKILKFLTTDEDFLSLENLTKKYEPENFVKKLENFIK